jgi:hypothetical protein
MHCVNIVRYNVSNAIEICVNQSAYIELSFYTKKSNHGAAACLAIDDTCILYSLSVSPLVTEFVSKQHGS